MTSATIRTSEYFDYMAEEARIAEGGENDAFSRNMHGLLDSKVLELALRNQALQPDAIHTSPVRLEERTSLVFANDAEIAEEIERWYVRRPAEHRVEIPGEIRTHIIAKEVGKIVLDDPRTSWAVQQGLTIIPAEVLAEVQSGYLESTSPVERDGRRISLKGTALGVNAAIALVASNRGGRNTRELFEMTTITGLIVSLEQELANLPSPHYDLKPQEYIDNILGTFTGTWTDGLEILRNTYRWEQDTNLQDEELDAFIQTVSTVVFELAHAYNKKDQAANKRNLVHAREFLVDLVNARWHIRSIGPMQEEAQDEVTGATTANEQPESVSSPEEVLGSIFQVLSANGIDLPSGLSIESILASLTGTETIRGDFRPEQRLRNVLIEARKGATDPRAIRVQLAQLQKLVNDFTTRTA